MRDNVGKVLVRDQKLMDLEEKSEDLSANSSRFFKKARVLRKRMWWKNVKGTLVLVSVVVIAVGVVVCK